jgi:hypothetical protein
MFNWVKRKKWLLVNAILVGVLVFMLGVQMTDKQGAIDQSVKIGIGNEQVITLGSVIDAAGSVDYTYDGTDDNVQFQAALNALPATGGRLVDVSAVQKNFSATVTRAIANVIIEGSGYGSYFVHDGGTALFTAGGNNWKFENLRTDAGSITMGATTGWSWENVTINASYYAYRTDDATTAGSWNIPTGRGATYVIAASDAPAIMKAQADVVDAGTNLIDSLNVGLNLGYTDFYLSEGNFVEANDGNIDENNVHLVGSGWDTIITVKNQTITTLTAQTGIGSQTVKVVSTSGFYEGESIGLGATPDSYVIDSIDSTTQITLTYAAIDTYNIGANCVSIMTTLKFTGDGCSVSNLKIDGNNSNWPSISVDCGAAYEIEFSNGDDFLVDRVEVTNSRHRPLRGAGQRILVKNCYFHDMSALGGVHIEGISAAWYSNATIESSAFIMPDGLAATTTAFLSSFGSNLKLNNCYIYGGANFRTTYNSTILGSTFVGNDNSPTYCVAARGSKGLIFDTCIFNDERLYLADITIGILYETKDITVDSSHFINNAYIVGDASLNNINILGNTFADTTTATVINIAGGSGTECTNIKINDNTWNTVTGAGIYASAFAYINGFDFCDNTQVGSGSNNFANCNNLNINGNVIASPTTHTYRISNSQNINIISNQITGSTSRGVSLEANTVAPATPINITNNKISATTPYYSTGACTNVNYSGNGNYIARGEIRTYSGTIATLTENAFNSLDNPFGQAVRVLSLDIYVSTQAAATSPNIDCGIGNSATADYTTLFDDLPGETVGFYNSLAGVPGTQTVPILWASGAGNRYLNMSIKDAAATGMVATYVVTVMGN